MRRENNRSRGKFNLLLLALLPVLLTGGCEPSHVLDETTLVTGMGFDLMEDQVIRATITAPVVSSLIHEKDQVVSTTGTTLYGIMNKLDLQLDRRPRLGQLRILLFSEEMARKGIFTITGALDRVEVGIRPYLGVVEGQTYDLINASYPSIGNLGMFLYYSIYKNVRGEQLPSPTLHEFMRDYYSLGKDPILPLIEKKGNEVNIKGLALFQDDLYKGWVKPDKAFYIKLIRDQFRTGLFQVAIPTKGLGIMKPRDKKMPKMLPIVLDTIRSSQNIKLVSTNPPTFDVFIQIHTRLAEMRLKADLEDPKVVRTIEHEIEEKMQKEVADLLKILQKMEVDPIGFGEEYRAQHHLKQMDKEYWRKLYKQAKFTCRIKTEITRLNITD